MEWGRWKMEDGGWIGEGRMDDGQWRMEGGKERGTRGTRDPKSWGERRNRSKGAEGQGSGGEEKSTFAFGAVIEYNVHRLEKKGMRRHSDASDWIA